MSNDNLGDRMKRYESVTKYLLNRRSFTIIRIDGKAFHTYTRNLEKPFDQGLVSDLNSTAEFLCSQVQNTKFSYVHSDEISLFLTDFDTLTTQPWFGNEVQKIASVSASLASSKFNELRFLRELESHSFMSHSFSDAYKFEKFLREKLYNVTPANFDSRVFQVPTRTEALNYLYWRIKDCERNSISSVAQSLFSPRELHAKSGEDKKAMLAEKGILWDDLRTDMKYGRLVCKESYVSESTEVIRTGWKTFPCVIEDFSYLLPENL